MLMLNIANLLKQNKDEVGKHILFLGTDIPLKPRVEPLETLLAEAVEALSAEEIPGFAELPEAAKPAETRRLLARLGFAEKARQRAASSALKDLDLSEGWLWLAQLIKAGYFSLVFTFSPHDLLERGLELEKMAPGEDYNLEVVGLDDREMVSGAVHKSARITVVKLGGDLKRGFVPLVPEEVAANIRLVGGIIHSVSSRALLMVAHSPTEAEIVRYLSRSGGPIYWVSPKAPVEERGRFDEMKIEDPEGIRVHTFSPEVASFLSQRGPKENLLARERGEFDTFFAALQNRLLRRGLDTQIAYIKRKTLISSPDKPFKFLQPFDQKDSTIFFGREREARELQELVTSARLSVVLGRSGVGKTSLIRAGLVPILEEEGWLSLVLRPVGDVIARIKAKVIDWLEVGQADQIESSAPPSLAAFLGQALQFLEGRLVIFLDQFEEAFTKLPEDGRVELAQALAACLVEPELPVNVALCLREDHFADLCDIKATFPAVFDNVYRVKKLSRSAAMLAISKPAEKFRLVVEPNLIEKILNDLDAEGIDPSGLELVMYALNSAIPPTERVLSARFYRSLSGTDALLGDSVENSLRRLPWRERTLARRVLKDLVLSQNQRALVSDAKIAQDLDLKPEVVSTVLWELEDAGLLHRVEEENGNGEYELVHDFLAQYIGQWLTEKEAKAKETQAMLQRELRGFRLRGTLLSPEKLNLLSEQRESLSLDDEELRFIVASALKTDLDISSWMEKVNHLDKGWEKLLLRILRRGTEPQKVAALHLLERLGEPSLVQSLLIALPPALGEQRSALNALLSRGERGLVFEVTKGKTEERKRAISALARIGTPRAATSLIKALEDPDAEVRRTASLALEEIGGEKTADMLVRRLSSTSEPARWEIADTLVKLAGRVGTSTILKALGGGEISEGAWVPDDSAPAFSSLARKNLPPAESLVRDYVLGRLLIRKREVASARQALFRAQRHCQTDSDASSVAAALAEVDEVESHLARGFYTWKMFRKDCSHSGVTEESVLPPLALAWSFKAEDQVLYSPVVDQATVFCPSRNGQIYALDINSGALVWQQKMASHIDSSPAVEEGILFLGTNEGQLVALEAATGRLRWRFNVGGEIRSSPTVYEGLVFFGCWDGSLYAVDSKSGEEAWHTETGGEIYSSPALSQGRAVVGNWLGQVITLGVEKGNIEWQFPTSGEVYSSPAIQGENVFIGSDDGNLYCLRLRDGKLVWCSSLGSRVRSSPAVVGGKVIVGSSDGSLFCLSSETGQTLWQVKAKEEISSSPTVSGKVVFFCSRDGTVAVADLESGELLWKHSTAFGISSSPAVAEGKVILGMNYTQICAFQSQPSS